jgi:hypothetical protein
MLSRPLTAFEKWFTGSSLSVQLGVELINSRTATEFADFLLRTCSAYQLRCDGKNLIHTKNPVTVGSIPGSVSTARDVVQLTELIGRPNFSERLATISIRDNFVAMSVAHVALDGVSLIHLFKGFQSGHLAPQSRFPVAVDDILKSELSTVGSKSKTGSWLGDLSGDPLAGVPWSSKLRDSGDRPRVDALVAELPSRTLKCFDLKREKFDGLTDALWGACALVCHAIDGDQRGYGSTMWVSLRPYLKTEPLGNLIVPLTVVPKSVSKDMTIGELEKSFRRSFKSGIEKRGWLEELEFMLANGSRPRQGSSFFDVSNVGYFPTTGPFVDTWSQQSQTAMSCNGALAIAAVTVFGKERNARLTLRLPYSQHVFTRGDVSRVFKGVQYYLQHIDRSRKVGEVIGEIREAIA